MKRRTAIQSMGLVTTHVLFPGILAGFLTSCKSENQKSLDFKPKFFDPDSMEEIKELIDIIIPRTNTFSASEVMVHTFLDEVFALCLEADQKETIRSGINGFLRAFAESNNRVRLVKETDQRAYEGSENDGWFIPFKQYTMIGFFTSEEGETRASNYVPIPGDYQGDLEADDATLNYGKTGLQYYL